MFTRTSSDPYAISSAGAQTCCSALRTQHSVRVLGVDPRAPSRFGTAYRCFVVGIVHRERRPYDAALPVRAATTNPPLRDSNPHYFCRNRTQMKCNSHTILHIARLAAPTFPCLSARTPAAKSPNFALKNRLHASRQKPPAASLLAPRSLLLP